jgi:hypothetical protein
MSLFGRKRQQESIVVARERLEVLEDQFADLEAVLIARRVLPEPQPAPRLRLAFSQGRAS